MRRAVGSASLVGATVVALKLLLRRRRALSSSVTFETLDVFTDARFGGNQLAVVFDERERLSDVLQNFSDERWEELIELLDSAGSMGYVRQLIDNHLQRAKGALGALPASEGRDLLFELVRMSRSRRN